MVCRIESQAGGRRLQRGAQASRAAVPVGRRSARARRCPSSEPAPALAGARRNHRPPLYKAEAPRSLARSHDPATLVCTLWSRDSSPYTPRRYSLPHESTK